MSITADTDGALMCTECDRLLTWEAHDCESDECSYAFCPKCLIETSSDCEDTAKEELEQHLEGLKADLEVEVDLHGGRTVMAYNLRTAIIKVRKELEELKTAV